MMYGKLPIFSSAIENRKWLILFQDNARTHTSQRVPKKGFNWALRSCPILPIHRTCSRFVTISRLLSEYTRQQVCANEKQVKDAFSKFVDNY